MYSVLESIVNQFLKIINSSNFSKAFVKILRYFFSVIFGAEHFKRRHSLQTTSSLQMNQQLSIQIEEKPRFPFRFSSMLFLHDFQLCFSSLFI